MAGQFPYAPRSPLDIYRDPRGEGCDLAWHQLMSLGELKERTPRWEEAYAVARETMTRARQNVERIVTFLQDHGYVFGAKSADTARTPLAWRPPTPQTAEQLAQLTSLIGPMPLSVRAWYEVVGSVSLPGRFPDLWNREDVLPLNDALEAFSLDEILELLKNLQPSIEDYETMTSLEFLKEPGWSLYFAPDIHGKANYSGAFTEIRVPDSRADAPLLGVRFRIPMPPGARTPSRDVFLQETFVEYLRRSFQWAGFPGYAQWPGPGPEIERLKPLFAEMLPI